MLSALYMYTIRYDSWV